MIVNPYTEVKDKPIQTADYYGVDQLGDVRTFQAGFGSKGMRVNQEGMWLGGNTFAEAPFSVDPDGNLIARSGQFKGLIELGGAANENGLLKLYDSSGVQISQLDNGGMVVFGLSKGLRTSPSAAQYALGNVTGFVGASGNSAMTMQAALGILMEFICNTDAAFYMGAFSTGTLTINGKFNVTSDFRIHGHLFQIDDTAGITDNGFDVLIEHGGIVKTAIVPTSKGYRALYCIESPDVWFMDFCKVKKHKWWEFWKKPEYDIDPLFLETVEGDLTFVPTANKDIAQVWGKRKGFKNTRFEKKTKEQFIKNNKFWKN